MNSCWLIDTLKVLATFSFPIIFWWSTEKNQLLKKSFPLLCIFFSQRLPYLFLFILVLFQTVLHYFDGSYSFIPFTISLPTKYDYVVEFVGNFFFIRPIYFPPFVFLLQKFPFYSARLFVINVNNFLELAFFISFSFKGVEVEARRKKSW